MNDDLMTWNTLDLGLGRVIGVDAHILIIT